MKWNAWYDKMSLAILEREGYPQLYVLNSHEKDDIDHIKVIACMGRSGHPPMTHYSYAMMWLAHGSGLATGGDSYKYLQQNQVDWLHRDVWEKECFQSWQNMTFYGHPYVTPIRVSQLPMYLDLPYKSQLFVDFIKGDFSNVEA